MKLSRKMILVPEEEYLQLTGTYNEGEKPEEKCTKMDGSEKSLQKCNSQGKSQQK